MRFHLCGLEPAEISWTPEGITFVAGTEWEWWNEKLSARAKAATA